MHVKSEDPQIPRDRGLVSLKHVCLSTTPYGVAAASLPVRITSALTSSASLADAHAAVCRWRCTCRNLSSSINIPEQRVLRLCMLQGAFQGCITHCQPPAFALLSLVAFLFVAPLGIGCYDCDAMQAFSMKHTTLLVGNGQAPQARSFTDIILNADESCGQT